jgi:shikimate kinase
MGSADGSAPGFRRILLVGFMGSGKSTVASLLASRLGWTFLDFDTEIERRSGATVAEIFRTRGEPFFRELETKVGAELLERDRVVLASGGGWPVPAGRMESVGPETLTVWLDIDAVTAVARAGSSRKVRPLLQGPDPLGRAEALLNERRPRYRLAQVHLEAGRSTSRELAEQVLYYIKNVVDVAPR